MRDMFSSLSSPFWSCNETFRKACPTSYPGRIENPSQEENLKKFLSCISLALFATDKGRIPLEAERRLAAPSLPGPSGT